MKALINGVPRSRLPEYRIWLGMRKRCTNPQDTTFAHYGGRGITVCDRWQDFTAFYTDMGARPTPRHEIDRIDNDGHYCPKNCRWGTKTEQANNRSDSRFVTYQGETLTVAQWAKRLGMNYATLKGRFAHMPLEQAMHPDKYREAVTYLESQGEIHTVAEWANICGILPVTLRARLQRGYTIAQALSPHLQPGRRNDLRRSTHA